MVVTIREDISENGTNSTFNDELRETLMLKYGVFDVEVLSITNVRRILLKDNSSSTIPTTASSLPMPSSLPTRSKSGNKSFILSLYLCKCVCCK